MNKREKEINKIKILIEKYHNKVPLNDIPINNFIDSHSWFDIKESEEFNFTNTLKIKKIENKCKIIKCKKIILLPNNKQRKILLDWLNSVRLMYNQTLIFIRNRYRLKEKTIINFRNLRKELMKKKNILKKLYKTPTHILDSGIKLASISYKSAFTNFKNNNIKHFNIRYIKQKKITHIMDIEKSFFNSFTFCPTILGKKMLNKSNFSYNEITKDCKLHYSQKNKRFTLLIPEEKEKKIKEFDNSFISVDPGVRTFLTGMSNNKHYEICTTGYITLKKYLNKIDNVKGGNNKEKWKYKLRNKVTDLHWKSINFLMKQNKNTIVIGNWSTKNCISKKYSLNKMLKRVCNSLRYFDFLNKLIYKSNYNNISLKIQNESYTSKLCSTCGTINKNLGSKKKFECLHCKMIYDRDMNACRNILIKSLK